MALVLEFAGWLNEKKEFDWGTVLKVTHKNRKQNDAGEWETTSTDYLDVVIDKNDLSKFSHVLDADVPTRIEVRGNAKFSTYEGKNGTGVAIKVYPQEISVSESNNNSAWAKPAETEVPF